MYIKVIFHKKKNMFAIYKLLYIENIPKEGSQTIEEAVVSSTLIREPNCCNEQTNTCWLRAESCELSLLEDSPVLSTLGKKKRKITYK